MVETVTVEQLNDHLNTLKKCTKCWECLKERYTLDRTQCFNCEDPLYSKEE